MGKYYEAYDKRYSQIHAMDLEWESAGPSPIVEEILDNFSISKESEILELGCGEGRDAVYLLNEGYNVCASDISPEAVAFCQKKHPEFADRFIRLNACEDELDKKFDFIYSVAVIHMLVLDEDRNRFLSFIKSHLKENGLALILTMGNGEFERASDISRAFENAIRTHEKTGQKVEVAETSCRMVSFETLEQELKRNGLTVVEKGLTAVEPAFPVMMYVVVR